MLSAHRQRLSRTGGAFIKGEPGLLALEQILIYGWGSHYQKRLSAGGASGK